MTDQEQKEIKALEPAEAVARLDIYLKENPKDTDALTLRGMRHWGLGHRAEAINDYLAALEIDPACKAREALQATNDILNYYNKDLYNP